MNAYSLIAGLAIIAACLAVGWVAGRFGRDETAWTMYALSFSIGALTAVIW